MLVRRDAEIMSGDACFTGTRVPVRTLFDYVTSDSSLESFLDNFPSVSRETAVAVLEESFSLLLHKVGGQAPAAQSQVHDS